MWPRGVVAVALAFAAGCDRLLGLTPFPDAKPDVAYPAQVINDPDGDYDRDGSHNAVDLCPTIDNNQLGGMSDRDGDGVGDLCDPNPDTPGDCLVLFDDFTNETALSPHWQGNGGPIAIGDVSGQKTLQFYISDEEIVSLDVPLDLDAVTVIAYVQAGDQGTTATRAAIEVFVDLELSTSPIAANGTSCAIESMDVPTKVEQLQTVAGVDTPTTVANVGAERIGSSTDVRIDWSPSLAAPAGCRAYVHDALAGTMDTAMVTAPMPSSKTFAIRGIGVGLEIYAIAGWGHACPAGH